MAGVRVELVIPGQAELAGWVRGSVGVFSVPVIGVEGAADLEAAVGEALANAVEHGSPLGQVNRIVVVLWREPGRVVVQVSDEGHGFDVWSQAPPAEGRLEERGRGLVLMRALCWVRHDRGGSRVTLEARR